MFQHFLRNHNDQDINPHNDTTVHDLKTLVSERWLNDSIIRKLCLLLNTTDGKLTFYFNDVLNDCYPEFNDKIQPDLIVMPMNVGRMDGDVLLS